MKDNNKRSTSQLFNFAENSYLERTSRPIYAIVFLLPFIIFYELGTILINTDVLNRTQVRVVAFVWLQDFLEYLGFGSRFAWAAPALAVMIILIALQLTSRKRWSFVASDIWLMTAECVLFAVPLIVLSLSLNSSAQPQDDISQFANNATQIQTEAVTRYLAVTIDSLQAVAEGVKHSLLADIVTGIGAGIYEELIFRLILISLLMILFQNVLGLNKRNSIIASVLVSAALFSAHHHIIFLHGRIGQTSPFNWTEFGFRTIAGVYFAILFAIRGFGITAGTHAFYDIIAITINAAFFQY